MSEQSPRMSWSYPSRDDDPWYDSFSDFVNASDGSAFASREDRSLIWSGGGTLSWTLSSETFAWTNTINIYSPMSGKLIQVAAGSVVGWADGEIVYVDVTRLALTNTTKTLQKATSLPSTDDAVALAVRIGNLIFFRTGISLADGNIAIGVAPVPGSGSSPLEIEDEGVVIDDDVVIIDFVGEGIAATQTVPGRVEVSVTNASPFEADIGNNEIQPVTADIGRSFIVGSQAMDDSGPTNDARMFFEKSSGAFRAGNVSGAEWDSGNRGVNSFASGLGNTASGAQSFAEGYVTVASGDQAHAQGSYTIASGDNSMAHGYGSAALLHACKAHANQYFDNIGDGQALKLMLSLETTDATPSLLVPSPDVLSLTDNGMWGFSVRILGRTGPTDSSDSYFAIIEGMVSRSGVNVSLVPGPSPLDPRLEVSSSGASSWSAYVEDSTTGNMHIRVVGEAARTVRWIAELQVNEIIWLP